MKTIKNLKKDLLYLIGCIANFYIIPCAIFSALYRKFQFYISNGLVWLMVLGWLVQLAFTMQYGRMLERSEIVKGGIKALVISLICFIPTLFGDTSPLLDITFSGPRVSALAIIAVIAIDIIGIAAGWQWRCSNSRPGKKKKRKSSAVNEDDVFN